MRKEQKELALPPLLSLTGSSETPLPRKHFLVLLVPLSLSLLSPSLSVLVSPSRSTIWMWQMIIGSVKTLSYYFSRNFYCRAQKFATLSYLYFSLPRPLFRSRTPPPPFSFLNKNIVKIKRFYNFFFKNRYWIIGYLTLEILFPPPTLFLSCPFYHKKSVS